jgi:putative inorganic carbon (HCO3(-)) transporter
MLCKNWLFNMFGQNKKLFILIITFVFFAINTYLITKEFYLFSVFPLIILIAYLYFKSLDIIFFLAIALTPLSFELYFENFNMGINLPSEALLVGIVIFFFFKLLLNNPLNNTFTKHAITFWILLHLFWMFITSLTSQIPLVSFKYFFMQLWFIVPLYFFGSLLLSEKKKVYTFLFLIIISVCLTVIYTTIHHAMYGFAEKSGNWVMKPFYNDHTAYGAVLALLLPVTIGIFLKSSYSKTIKFFILISSVLIVLGIFLSFSRATWMSVALSFAFFVIVVYRIKLRYLVLTGLFIMGIVYLNMDTIMRKLEKNRQDSSTHFVEHVRSITNISTDASNLERINRWKSSMRMFKDYPVFGTGSGTYQFLYAPYQKSKDRTIISTNAGDLGNAHSEYLTPLSERGVLGLLFFLGIIISVFVAGIRTYHRTKDAEIKMISISLLTGLFSYLTHGFLNNFLDKDYASVIFWGFICIIASLHIAVKEHSQANQNESIIL